MFNSFIYSTKDLCQILDENGHPCGKALCALSSKLKGLNCKNVTRCRSNMLCDLMGKISSDLIDLLSTQNFLVHTSTMDFILFFFWKSCFLLKLSKKCRRNNYAQFK